MTPKTKLAFDNQFENARGLLLRYPDRLIWMNLETARQTLEQFDKQSKKTANGVSKRNGLKAIKSKSQSGKTISVVDVNQAAMKNRQKYAGDSQTERMRVILEPTQRINALSNSSMWPTYTNKNARRAWRHRSQKSGLYKHVPVPW